MRGRIAVGQSAVAGGGDHLVVEPRSRNPIGTSPDFRAVSAAFSAKSMKEGAVMVVSRRNVC